MTIDSKKDPPPLVLEEKLMSITSKEQHLQDGLPSLKTT
jgi:hypothetical protein